jgi:hypothetical protein
MILNLILRRYNLTGATRYQPTASSQQGGGYSDPYTGELSIDHDTFAGLRY